MLIDVTMYAGPREEEMLRFRLAELSPYVGRFVVVEADFTHQGGRKEVSYELFDALNALPAYRDKITLLPCLIEEAPAEVRAAFERCQGVKPEDRVGQSVERKGEAWTLGYHQRNYPMEWLASAAAAEDQILLADLDEVPDFRDRDILRNAWCELLALVQSFHYYSFKWVKRFGWCGPVILRMRDLTNGRDLQYWRDQRWTIRRRASGWHLSYFGSPPDVASKIAENAHTEFITPHFTDVEKVRARMERGLDLFERGEQENMVPVWCLHPRPQHPARSDLLAKYFRWEEPSGAYPGRADRPPARSPARPA